jgi:hypothetical protein
MQIARFAGIHNHPFDSSDADYIWRTWVVHIRSLKRAASRAVPRFMRVEAISDDNQAYRRSVPVRLLYNSHRPPQNPALLKYFLLTLLLTLLNCKHG